MKVLLATTPLSTEKKFMYPTTYPPLGILYLSSYLRHFDSDLNIKIIDGKFLTKDSFLKNIEKENPDVIGLSFTTPDCKSAQEISWSIKKIFPNVLLIGGGPHPTAMPEITLRNSAFDLFVIGEGEKTFKEIVSRIKKKKDIKRIKGLAFLKNGKFFFTGVNPPIENLDSIPFPARDLINIRDYSGYYFHKKSPETNFLSSRGCPFNCIFCSNPVWKFYKYRIRSPENIVEELSLLKQKYKINELFDYCDEINFDRNKAIEICDSIKDSKLDIKFKTHIRADNVSDKLAESMSKAGFWLVFIGMESSSDKTLKGIRKGITVNQIIQSCKKFKKYGIKVAGYFMAFNVWKDGNEINYESINDVKRTFNFIKKLKKEKLIDFVHFGITKPMPGSKLYDIANESDLIKNKEDCLDYGNGEILLNLKSFDEQEFKIIRRRIAFLQAKELLFSGNLNPKYFNFFFKFFYHKIIKSFI